MSVKKWLNNNTFPLDDKVIAITGSTGGIGNEVVSFLASKNAKLLLLNRDEEKTNLQIEKLLSINPNLDVSFIKLDLRDLENVKEVSKILSTKEIDILILNSGVYNVERTTLDSSLDNVFQINCFSNFLLVNELKNKVKKVVMVSSIAHNYTRFNPYDVECLKGNTMQAYGNSKRLLMYSLFELQKIGDFELSIVHPGVTLTHMTNHYPKWINWLVKIGIAVLFPSRKKAALNIISGIYKNTMYHTWIGPSIFNIWGYPKLQNIKYASKDESETIYSFCNSMLKTK